MVRLSQRLSLPAACAALCLVALTLSPSRALAQSGTIDQVSPGGTAGFNRDAASLIWQQQIRAGAAGKLEGIAIIASSGGAGAQVNVRIRKGAAPSSSPLLFDQLNQEVYLGFDTLTALCEQGVRTCSDSKLIWNP